MTTVTVIVPCRNEAAYVGAFCKSLLAQSLPDAVKLQVVIADGMSDDGTRDMLDQLCLSNPQIERVDNPQRIVSTGLNMALTIARGDVIVRMDMHTEYAGDYVAQCLAELRKTGADNVGGAWQALPPDDASPMQAAVSAAFQSRWVAGGARSRQRDYNGWVDTVYLGCWPRRTFERFGCFDETLVRNQDDEHNLRLSKGGARIWQSSLIRSAYRPRASLSQVFRQYMQYGYWKPFVMKKHRQPASLRHLVPAVLVAGLVVSAFIAMAGVGAWPLVGLSMLYAGAIVGLTAAVVADGKLSFRAAVCVPLVIATYHLSYGIGSLLGWWDVLRGARSRARLSELTR